MTGLVSSIGSALGGTPATQTQQPWQPTQPYLKQTLGAAQGLYNAGTGYGLSPQYQHALTAQNAAGIAGNPYAKPTQANLTGLMKGGGISTGSTYQGLLAQGGGVGTGTYQGLVGQGGGISTGGAYQGLLGQGGGINTAGQDQSLLGQVGNPAFEGALDTQAGKLTDDVNREYSGLGRTGSSAESGAVAQQVGDFRAQALANQWQQNVANQRGIISDVSQTQNQNMGNQLTAASGLTNAQNLGMQNQLASASGLANVQNMNMGNQLSAASGLTSAQNAAAGNQLSAAGLAPGAYAASLAPIQQRLAAGQGWNQAQNSPWQRLQAYSSLVGGPASMGGTQTQQPASNPLGQIIGGGLLGASMFGA